MASHVNLNQKVMHVAKRVDHGDTEYWSAFSGDWEYWSAFSGDWEFLYLVATLPTQQDDLGCARLSADHLGSE